MTKTTEVKMDYQVFRTRKEAQKEIAQMRGWPKARAVSILDNDLRKVWIVQCDDCRFLREDGYVR